jgi:hypothetical protein
VIRLAPPLILTTTQVDEFAAALPAILDAAAAPAVSDSTAPHSLSSPLEQL